MTEAYDIAFTIAEAANPGLPVVLAAIVCLVCCGVGLYLAVRHAHLRGGLISSVGLFIGLAAAGLGTSRMIQFSDMKRLYTAGKTETFEGEVEVLHAAPAHGHDTERVVIDGHTIEFVPFSATGGYTQGIYSGGVLTPGTHARVQLVDGIIVEALVRQNDPPTSQTE